MIDGKKNKRQVNGAEVTNILLKEINNNKIDDKITFSKDQFEDQAKVIVEHVTAMPGQGVTSMFNFGQSFGVLKGICAALKIPIYFVRPTKWKKHFNLIKTNKDASRTKVIEIYPNISGKLSRKKDSNKADAILIARHFNDTQL
jgi:crossover junction endodeoxyribonuclease RuvC